MFIHVAVCFLLVLVVLLQSGKSADLAGAFGGYGSQSTFGPRGTASMLSKMTTTLAVMFMVTSLLLWMFSGKRRSSSSVLGGGRSSRNSESTRKNSGAVPVGKSQTGQLPLAAP